MSKKLNEIKISFVDSCSAEDVTGSNVYIETPKHKILLDCGLHQSNDVKEDYLINNRKTREYKPKDIDLIFISHNHVDHCGIVPKYYKDGFRGGVVIPTNSKETLSLMLSDCAHINDYQIKVLNDQENKSWNPLYLKEDVDACMEHVLEKPINQKIKIDDEISFMFVPSGHLLNGCQILLWITIGNNTKCIGYTGDIGNPNVDNKYVGKFEPIEKCDLLISESTYGDRQDLKIRKKERDNDLKKLKTIIDTQICLMHGKVVVPVFAQSRSVQLINLVYNLYKDDESFKYKVYLDSPLAIKLLKEMRKSLSDDELEEYDKMIAWDNLVLVNEAEESKALVASNEPCLILSTSGMCSVGRIRHHLKSIVSNSNATMLFCGYSTDGSLASMLKDNRRKEINIDGKAYKIRCSSYNLKSLSGHAMFDFLVEYYSSINCNKIILHHGSHNAKNSLAKVLSAKLSELCKSTRVICANGSLKFTI